MSIFSHGGFVNPPETKLGLFSIFTRLKLEKVFFFYCSPVAFMLQYQRYILVIGNCKHRGNCCQDRDPYRVYLSLLPRLSLRSVKFSIIYILTLPERHRPIKRPSGGVSCGLYFYESSRRVFTGSAWLHVPDRPHSYSTAYKKGMVINGINNILLRDAVIKLSVGEQTIFQEIL